jgi:beta-lactamase superfamily II metal-dependent hydrolase
MRFQIYDIGHGFSGLLTGDNGSAVLFDCGHSDTFRPSIYLPHLGVQGLDQFIITNFDHDHVSDLDRLRASLPIRSISRNPTMPADQLRRLKLQGGPLSGGLAAAIELHSSYTAPLSTPLYLGGTVLTHYWNPYPAFEDTNNLSYLTFIDYGDLRILVPGDMEKTGWRALLLRASFLADLRRTTIFVASHHGRDSGYCKEVFDYCRPAITIISDDEIQYDSQEHCYGTHSTGLAWSDGSTRRVLTTRSDGHITITKNSFTQISSTLGYSIRTHPTIPPI